MKKITLYGILLTVFSVPALAEEVAGANGGASGLIAISAGLAIGLAAIGGALGQGKIGAAAMDGIARNPQAAKAMFVPMILGLALVESLVIYALIIGFQLAGKV